MGRTEKRKSQADDSSWSYLRLIIKVHVSQFPRIVRAKAIRRWWCFIAPKSSHFIFFHHVSTASLTVPTDSFVLLYFAIQQKSCFATFFFSSSLCYDAGRSKSIFFQFEFGFDKFFVLLHSIKHHNFSLRNFLRHCFAHQCAHFPICFSHIIISSFVFIFVVVRWMTNGRVT